MKIILFCLILAGASVNVFAAGTCKAPQPLSANLMTPLGIQGWLRTVGTKVKSVRDFVCCLPQEFRSNYMVGHSSVAGQNGTPESPRIIMSNKSDVTGKGRSVELLMSFNGGESHMSGNQSIEMAYINPKNKETEYFDLSFDDKKGKHLSNKNPESCMNCHGDMGKAPPGGAKIIFDVFGDWHRFVGGVTIFTCNEIEDRLRAITEDYAVKSVKSNPQYDCLDKSLLEKDAEGKYSKLDTPLSNFDNNIRDTERIQRQKWLESIPEAEKFRYMSIGYDLCGGPLTEWMSPDIIRRNFANLDIDPRLKKDGSLEKVLEEAIADEDRKVSEFKKMQADLIKNNKINFKEAMQINRSSRACLATRTFDKEEKEQLLALARRDESKYFANRDPITLLKIDNYLKSPRL